MIDLRKIISQLDSSVYQRLEQNMIKRKADNSLFLLKTYRTGNTPDKIIINELNINPTALYTLKSRLYDKIQDHITDNLPVEMEDIIGQVNQIHQVCYNSSKDVAIAFLTKLEENLLVKDMHGELLIVYSALKQLNLFSDRYFHYAQLYNKQIAYSLTLEKSNEILGNFNRHLAKYDFSRSEEDLDTLKFLYNGIQEQYALNASKQIELIRNIIEIQLSIFTNYFSQNAGAEPKALLKQSEAIISELPDNAEQKQWQPVLDYLYFEYFNKKDDLLNAKLYYEKVNKLCCSLPFYSNIGLVSKFHISKLNYLQKTDLRSIAHLDVFNDGILDSKNMHSVVLATIYNSVILFYSGELKSAIAVLNNLLNKISVKGLHSINIDVKLTLAFYYIKKHEPDMAENILKSLTRKIKTDDLGAFAYVNNLIKLFLLDINDKNKQQKLSKKDLYVLFSTQNKNYRLLSHLSSELDARYAV